MSFRLKTILGVAIIEIVLLVILVSMSLRYLSLSNQEQLQFRANSTAELVARSTQDALLSYDLATLESLVQHLMKNPEMVYITIDDNHSTLAIGGLPPEGVSLSSAGLGHDLSAAGVIGAMANITIAGKHYGTVKLGISTSRTDALITDATRYLSGVALGEVVLVGIFSLALGTYLTTRLKTLEEASDNIRKRGPGFQIRLGGRDEIANVVKAFNEMSVSLAVNTANSKSAMEAYRKLAFKAARDEAMTKVTLEACLDGIIRIDEKGTIIEVNDQAADMFGWQRSELLNKSMADTLIPEPMREMHNAGMQRYLETGKGVVIGRHIELSGLHRDGHEFPVELSIAETRYGSETSFTAFMRDVSERKQATNALEHARRAADQANHAKSRFLATMSHEIRSPLNAVINMNELLLESGLRDDQIELARVAREGGLTLLALINDILDFSRIESGKVEFNPRATKLKTTVQSVAELHAGIAGRNKIALQTIIHPEMDQEVMIDDIRLRQVLNNLLSNALKFTSEGGVIVRLMPDEDTNYFVLSVSDTGVGIPSRNQREIFEEFRQLDDSDARRFAGSGLGLSIIKRLIDGMQGRIDVDSVVGQGSTFTVRFPLQTLSKHHYTPAYQDFHTDAVFINLENSVMSAAIHELCRLWGLNVYNINNGDEYYDTRARNPVMLVDYDADGKKRPCNRYQAHCLLPDAEWRYIPVTSMQSGPVRYSTEITGFFGFLRAPIRIETFLRFVTKKDPHEQIDSLESENTVEFVRCNSKILLVDDSESNLAVGKALMSGLGCHIETATDGAEAVQMASDKHYDIIFMDLAMPNMDGLEATSLIRGEPGLNQVTPIIALTANAFAEDRERCLSMGMTDYLSKPINRNHLFEILVRYSPGSKHEPGTVAGVTAEQSDPSEALSDTQDTLLDPAVLQQLAADTSADALPRLLDIYLQEIGQRVDAMLGLDRTQQRADLEREAHSLKSSSASFGAPRLAGLCKGIESAAREGDDDKLASCLGELEAIAKSTLDAMHDYLARSNDG